MADDMVRHRLSWKVAGSSTTMGVRPGCGAKRKDGAARLTATTRSDEELRTTETDDESGTPSLSTATRQTISPSSLARRMASKMRWTSTSTEAKPRTRRGRRQPAESGDSFTKRAQGYPSRVHLLVDLSASRAYARVR